MAVQAPELAFEVRFGLEADIASRSSDVRSTSESSLQRVASSGPLWARKRHHAKAAYWSLQQGRFWQTEVSNFAQSPLSQPRYRVHCRIRPDQCTDGWVSYRIIGSSFPNWDGTDQKRLAEITGDQLKWMVPAASTANGESTVLTLTRAK